MTAYRRILFAIGMILIVLVLVFVFFDRTAVSSVYAGVFLAEMLLDVAATTYIGLIVFRNPLNPRSWILMMIFTSALFVTIGVVGIGAVVIYRLTGFAPLPPEIGLAITAICILIAGTSPIVKAALIYFIAREEQSIPPVTKPE